MKRSTGLFDGHGLAAVMAALVAVCLTAFSQQVSAQPEAECDTTRYTFSWNMESACALSPRGGTSTGTGVTLDTEPSPGWLALQKPGQSDFEKDRQAILAMAGEYRASFEFLETVGYAPGFERAAPYQSWGTEVIYVITDEPEFISLQHLIVMFVQGADGEVQGPFVQKHWRQDWQYEKPSIMEFAGGDTWRHRKLTAGELSGKWMQSVFQVDDSPRYESLGEWRHYPNFSTWISETTWRPLPRRESSVRSDYDVLEGTNRHTIVPTGWVHEEENLKRVLTDAEIPYVSKELGVNRYERVKDFDFSAGEEYWQQTASNWATIREVWQELFAADSEFTLRETVDGVPLFARLFQAAESDSQDAAAIRGMIAPYTETD